MEYNDKNIINKRITSYSYKNFIFNNYYTILIIVIILIIIIIIIYLLFTYNILKPASLIKYLTGFWLFLIIYVIFVIISLILWYIYYYRSINFFFLFKYFINILIILGSIILLGFVLWFIFIILNTLLNTSNIYLKSLNIVIIIIVSIILIALLFSSSYVKNSPITKSILNMLLYFYKNIYNLFNYILNIIRKEKQPSYTEIFLIIVLLIILLLYFTIPQIEKYFILNIDTQLINNPIYLNIKHTIGSYESLYNVKKNNIINIINKNININKILHFANDLSYMDKSDIINNNYNYSISFWLYLDSLPPNATNAYNKYNNILSFGDNLTISYKPSTTTLSISVKNGSLDPNKYLEIDDNGNKVIYKNTNMLLQKWHNFILVYNVGTLDVFINGNLIKSIPNMIKFMKMDLLTVGEDDGINSLMCNFMWFNYSLNLFKIYYLYNYLKYKSLPILYINKNKDIIDIIDNVE